MPRANLKKKMPAHAQHIYDKAHNQAIEQYKNPKKRRGRESQEAAAHKVAWAAVKKEYKKSKDEKWHKK